jgi:hypothetical protein
MIDAGLYIAYVLLFVAIGAAILFPLLYIIKDPKGVVKSLAGIGALVVIFILCYAMSGDEVTPKYLTYGVGSGSSKMIGAGLMMFYAVLAISVVGVIYSEISKALK